jgi:hypothetical protein
MTNSPQRIKTNANADELVHEKLCARDLLRELGINLLAFMLSIAPSAFRRSIWKLLQREILSRGEQQVSRMERQMGIP